MDQQLLDILHVEGAGVEYRDTGRAIEFVNPAGGEIRVDGPGGPREYALKPLRELYGEGNHAQAVDPESSTFMPLFLAIEEEITRFYQTENPRLTDGAVALVLDQLGMDPEAVTSDPLAVRVQMAVRVCLSLNNYSRQEVKSVLRKIGKSVDRHTRADGPRGYLDFIAEFFGRRR